MKMDPGRLTGLLFLTVFFSDVVKKLMSLLLNVMLPEVGEIKCNKVLPSVVFRNPILQPAPVFLLSLPGN
jgi:hypothetical protein